MKKVLFSSLLITFLFGFSQGIQAQLINTVAGTGSAGYSGDGGLAVAGKVSGTIGITIDASGNVYFADANNNCVRKISSATGIITTVAGIGTAGFSGDGAAATAAQLNTPAGVALDASGNIYICDQLNERVRVVNASTGIITTVAGTGTAAFGGDGSAATLANINRPYCVAFDASGNFYIADRSNDRVRKVTISTGIISTFAGSGTVGFTGDGGAATAADLNRPEFLLFDASGNLYITDNGNNRIRVVNTSGVINTIAGTGGSTYAGDGSPATATGINSPVALAFDASGNLLVADAGNSCIRKITSGIITTVAGTGTAGYTGECGAPTATELNLPQGIAVSSTGVLYISDGNNNRVRSITQPCSGTPAAGTAIASATTGCPLYPAVVSLNGASSGCYYAYQWLSSTDGTTFSVVSGATNSSYAPTLTTSIYFKCVVSCTISSAVDTSTAVLLNVNHLLDLSPITGNTNVCLASSYSYSDTATSGGWSATNSLLTIDASTGIVTTGTITGIDTILYSATNVCGTARDTIIVTINPSSTPAVSVSAFPGTSVCHGSSVTYTAVPVNGGTSPSYQWYVNGIFAGIGSSLTYTPSDGDTITCVMASSLPCPTASTVTNYVVMSVVSLLTPSIVVTDGILGDSVCRGIPVTFNTIITNGGSSPSYSWAVNGVSYGAGASYTYTPTDGDVVSCTLTSSFTCAAPSTAIDSVKMTVDTVEFPSIVISANPGDSSCSGFPVIFSTSTRYGGLTPSFLWIENGINVATGPTYTYVPTNGDSVQCVLFSSAACRATGTDSVYSNVIHMFVGPYDTMSATIAAHPGTLVGLGQRDTIIATVFNGGTSTTFTWYKNSMLVPGATTNVYITDTLAEGDVVFCRVHGSNPCSTPAVLNTNSLLFHIISGVQQVAASGMNLILTPNPNRGTLKIDGDVAGTEDKASIQVTNVVGDVVYTSSAAIVNGRVSKEIALDNQLANGVYLLQVSTNTSRKVIRFTLDK